MERATHMQLDRIEMKIDQIENLVKYIIHVDTNENILDFIEIEVHNKEKGRLTHLKDDKKLEAIREELRKDTLEDIEEEEQDEEEEYKQDEQED